MLPILRGFRGDVRGTTRRLLRALPLFVCFALSMRHADAAESASASSVSASVSAMAAVDGALLNDHADVLIDSTDSMTFDDARRSTAFEPLGGRTALGLIDHPVWLRVHVRAPAGDAVQGNATPGDVTRDASEPGESKPGDLKPGEAKPDAGKPDEAKSGPATQTWWLDLSPFSMADVQIFTPGADAAQWRIVHTGEEQPFASRPLAWRQFLVPVTLRDAQDTTVYLRLRGYNTLVVPMRIWRLSTWARHALADYLVIGVCLGVMGGLALYNLLLAARLRQTIFVLYALLVSSYAVFSADLLGLGSQYLWPASFVGVVGRNQALVCLYGCFGALFPLYLLDHARVTRWYRPVLHTVAAIYAVSSLFALHGAYGIAGLVIQALPCVWFPIVIGVALYRSAMGFRPAWYYLIGYGPVIVALTMLILIGQNTLRATPLTMHAFLVAGAFEAILFSQALAERFNILRRERERALELAVGAKHDQWRAAEEHKAELEAKVALRTHELESSEAALKQLAYYDALTELPNRLLFRDDCERLIDACRRDGGTFTLAVVDLNGFKRVNDTLGHHAGDHLLRVVARRLRDAVRERDTVSRLGGDEFGILFPELARDRIAGGALLDALHEACAEPVLYEGGVMQVSGSIGLATFGDACADRDAMYRAADREMYRAKSVHQVQL
ncbi:diguanylate cyclase [Pararobbsia silviterrae]|uniref:GGDEF domain-containing protein n=1 Tax=Pararobbsia silviterrae TaxID=1792498 RepID=A0A494YGK0_9BURK|nr:diguanylate cyclase [Pararobbsia silviterrae]RKP59157.1 GGDEF domain-containing protein [Pararobbsia silviterrae]